jgi:putative tricarboxylic transport membrane protein
MASSEVSRVAQSSSSALFKPLMGPLLILLAAVYFYVLAGGIDENPMPEQLGPAFWPRTLLILLMVSCGIKAIEVLAAGAKEASAKKGGVLANTDIWKLVLMIAAVLGVVFLMETIGFVLANFLFLLFFMIIAGYRRAGRLLLITGGGTIALLFLFVKIVYLPLPKGQFFFNDLTILLYRLLFII